MLHTLTAEQHLHVFPDMTARRLGAPPQDERHPVHPDEPCTRVGRTEGGEEGQRVIPGEDSPCKVSLRRAASSVPRQMITAPAHLPEHTCSQLPGCGSLPHLQKTALSTDFPPLKGTGASGKSHTVPTSGLSRPLPSRKQKWPPAGQRHMAVCHKVCRLTTESVLESLNKMEAGIFEGRNLLHLYVTKKKKKTTPQNKKYHKDSSQLRPLL